MIMNSSKSSNSTSGGAGGHHQQRPASRGSAAVPQRQQQSHHSPSSSPKRHQVHSRPSSSSAMDRHHQHQRSPARSHTSMGSGGGSAGMGVRGGGELSPVRFHESHPAAIRATDAPGPGTYSVKSSFDNPYKHNSPPGRNILKGFSIRSKPRPLPPCGADSPGPKYDLERATGIGGGVVGVASSGGGVVEESQMRGVKWSSADRFMKHEVTPGCPDTKTPSPCQYRVAAADRFRFPRLKGGACFAPPLTASRQRPEKKPTNIGRGQKWKQHVAEQTEKNKSASDNTFGPAKVHTHTDRTLCSFGTRPQSRIAVTPGPGEYDSPSYNSSPGDGSSGGVGSRAYGKAMMSSKQYGYFSGKGHGDMFGGPADRAKIGPGRYQSEDAPTRPHSPGAFLGLTG